MQSCSKCCEHMSGMDHSSQSMSSCCKAGTQPTSFSVLLNDGQPITQPQLAFVSLASEPIPSSRFFIAAHQSSLGMPSPPDVTILRI